MTNRGILLAALAGLLVRAADPEPLPPPDAALIKKWSGLSAVVIGKLTEAKPGPVARSEPPIYSHTLTVEVEEALRGAAKKGEKLQATHQIKQMTPPTFPVGKRVAMGVKTVGARPQAMVVEELDEKQLREIRAVLALPLGWTVEKGKYRSPWAALGKEGWPAGSKLKASIVCYDTGRPALTVGDGVAFTVEPVEPKMKMKFGNPDGDGEYRVTLTNPGKEAVEVPALLTDGKAVLWKECLVIQCQGKTYTIPGAAGVKGDVRPLTLKPGESASTTVQALALKGPMWPRGGYRIEFTFGLGEKAETKSFYYLSKHHDPIRDAAQAGK
jgi:hypothetical protein